MYQRHKRRKVERFEQFNQKRGLPIPNLKKIQENEKLDQILTELKKMNKEIEELRQTFTQQVDMISMRIYQLEAPKSGDMSYIN